MENIKKALQDFVTIDKKDTITIISLILKYDYCDNPGKGTIAFSQFKKLLSKYSQKQIKEAFGWAAQLRMMLPSWRRGIKSLCWGDRHQILTEPTIRYEVLKVVQHLVHQAVHTGKWDAEYAVKNVFDEMTDIDSELGLKVVKDIAKNTKPDYREEGLGDFPYFFIPIMQLKEIFTAHELKNRKDTDLWIVELKATDILSPETNISLLIGNDHLGFELNPSLGTMLK